MPTTMECVKTSLCGAINAARAWRDEAMDAMRTAAESRTFVSADTIAGSAGRAAEVICARNLLASLERELRLVGGA
jgi:hypothetical protein